MRCAACLKSEVPCSGMLKVPKVQDCMWIWCFTFFLGCTKHSHKAPFSTLMVVSGWFAWQVSITDGISRKVALDLRSFYSREWYQWVVPLKHWTTHCLRCFSAAGIANGARSWIVECIECMFFLRHIEACPLLFWKVWPQHDGHVKARRTAMLYIIHTLNIMYYILHIMYYALYIIYILYSIL